MLIYSCKFRVFHEENVDNLHYSLLIHFKIESTQSWNNWAIIFQLFGWIKFYFKKKSKWLGLVFLIKNFTSTYHRLWIVGLHRVIIKSITATAQIWIPYWSINSLLHLNILKSILSIKILQLLLKTTSPNIQFSQNHKPIITGDCQIIFEEYVVKKLQQSQNFHGKGLQGSKL